MKCSSWKLHALQRRFGSSKPWESQFRKVATGTWDTRRALTSRLLRVTSRFNLIYFNEKLAHITLQLIKQDNALCTLRADARYVNSVMLAAHSNIDSLLRKETYIFSALSRKRKQTNTARSSYNRQPANSSRLLRGAKTRENSQG